MKNLKDLKNFKGNLRGADFGLFPKDTRNHNLKSIPKLSRTRSMLLPSWNPIPKLVTVRSSARLPISLILISKNLFTVKSARSEKLLR